MHTQGTGAAGRGPTGAGPHGAPGHDRRRSVIDGLGPVVVTVLVLTALGALGYELDGVLGAIGGAVVGLILLGVTRMLLTLSGVPELARRRRRH